MNEEGLPKAVVTMIDFLALHGIEQEGIFRLSGASDRIHELREQLDRGKRKF